LIAGIYSTLKINLGITITKKKIDVLIVGAGLSGLTAAYHLEQVGISVAVLEARVRIGGRIHTVTANDKRGAFDLGPAWFWPHQGNVIAMLKAFGLGYFKQYETGYAVLEQQLNARPQKFVPNWQQAPSFRIVGGTIALANALAERLAANTIHLDHIVQAITLAPDANADGDNHITVQASHHGTQTIWRASHVIVTLPPHLAATTITYLPALPADVLQAMGNTPTWMGEAMKVSLVYERPFWRDENLSGMAVSYAGPVQQFHDATPADDAQGLGALFGWVGNDGVGRTFSESDRRLAVIEQAIRLFGEQAAHPISYSEINWENEPFTTNLNSKTRVIANEHPQYGHPLLQHAQMEGRLWWATTETSPIEGGYLDGAISIGRTVAAKIAQKGVG